MTECCVTAVHAYTATEDNQLSFLEGALIYVLEPEEGGWALGRLVDGTEGWFPYDYVQPGDLQSEHIETPPVVVETNNNKPIRNATQQQQLNASPNTLTSKMSGFLSGFQTSQKKTTTPTVAVSNTEEDSNDGVQRGSIILSRGDTEKTLEKYLDKRPTKEELLSKNILQKKEKKPGLFAQSDKKRESIASVPSSPANQNKGKGTFFSKIYNSFRGSIPVQKPEDTTSIFGLPLESLVQGPSVPIIVEECVHYLQERGIQEGIFRLSGSRIEIEDLKRKFRTPEERPNLTTVADPHSVAVLLKQFFSQLPEPLMTFDLFDPFSELIETVKDHKNIANVPVTEIQTLLKRLPGPNLCTLKYLLKYLKDLSTHFEKTKMASSNLALVFGPNLLRSSDPNSPASLFGMSGSKLIEILIVHFEKFF